MSKFYTLRQNNSGGYFIQNEDVDSYVIIEATSLKHFKQIADDVLSRYSNYCECCGERWYVDDVVEEDGELEPRIRGKHYTEHTSKNFFDIGGKIIIYYLDGTRVIASIQYVGDKSNE